MKYAICSRGRVLENNISKLDLSNCVTIIDKNAQTGEKYHGLSVNTYEWLLENPVDMVVIFSNKYYGEIANQLFREYSIQKDRIVCWTQFIRELDDYERYCVKKRYINSKDIDSLLLVDDLNYALQYALKNRFYDSTKQPNMLGYYGRVPKFGVEYFVYDRLYQTLDEIDVLFDLIVCDSKPADIDNLISKCKCLSVLVPYNAGINGGLEECICALQTYGKVTTHTMQYCWIVECRNSNYVCQTSFKMFQVAHVPYGLIYNEDYIPIGVQNLQITGGILDSSGDNISIYNTQINECTALYWIWKNTSYDYVGMCHYRRYMTLTDNEEDTYYIRHDDAIELLNKYDIILTRLSALEGCSIKQRIRNSVIDDGLYCLAEKLVYEAMKKYHPESFSFFCQYMDGNAMYGYHMFVMSREHLNDYCEWLFPMILEVLSQINIDNAVDEKSRRVVGYFTECMLTVWVLERRLSIKELPMLQIIDLGNVTK